MPKQPRLGSRTIRIIIVATVLALGAAAVVLNLPKTTSPFEGPPPARLFPASDLRVVDGRTWSAHERADQAVATWLRHNPSASGAAFARWAVSAVPAPPAAGGPQQRQELQLLNRLKSTRTPAGLSAANWLSFNGRKPVWKLFVKQYKALAAPQDAQAAKKLMKRTLALANLVEEAARNRFRQPSPYQGDPSLLADVKDRFTKKFSYPSKHATTSFAALGVLTHFDPAGAAEYRRMADEVGFSRLYGGAHYPSDLAGGAYLGTLVAEYELHAPVGAAG